MRLILITFIFILEVACQKKQATSYQSKQFKPAPSDETFINSPETKEQFVFLSREDLTSLHFADEPNLPPISQATESCEDIWQGQQLDAYDYTTDSQRHALGINIGYNTYKNRLQKLGVHRQECLKDWTVLVFMAAENDLEPFGFWDLNEMEGGRDKESPVSSTKSIYGSSLTTDVLVQMDANGDDGLLRYHMFERPEAFNENLRQKDYEQNRFESVASPVAQLIPENSTQASSYGQKLYQFLQWGVRHYPAKHYMVIMWGHGQGFTTAQPNNLVQNENFPLSFPLNGGYGFNYRTKEFLSIPMIRKVLQTLSQKELKGHPIDIYASDACLMQVLEVAYELAFETKYIIGSAQTQHSLGLPYRLIMEGLNQWWPEWQKNNREEQNIRYLARQFPLWQQKAYLSDYEKNVDPQAALDFTMSSLDSTQLRNTLVPAMRDFVSSDFIKYILKNPARAHDVYATFKKTPSFAGSTIDLATALTNFRKILRRDIDNADPLLAKLATRLEARIATIQNAIKQTVIEAKFGDGYVSPKENPTNWKDNRLMSGLAIWFPTDEESLLKRKPDFQQSQFYCSHELTEKKNDNCHLWQEILFR